MKKLLMLSVLSLCFATGFTCSKNAPQQTTEEAKAPAQAEMAAPSADATPVSAEVAPVSADESGATPAETK